MATSCPGLSSIHRGVRRPFTPGAPQSLGLHCQKIKGPRIIDTKAATEKAAASDGLEPGYTQASPAALRSAFSKIDFEQREEIQAQVTGKIPEWLNGKFVINGCGDYTGVNHMFDGLAMVHKLRISNGDVFSSHRFLRTEAYDHLMKKGKVQHREFGTPAGGPGLSGLISTIGLVVANLLGKDAITDNASVNIVPFGDKVLASSESKKSLYELDVENLSIGPSFPLGVKCDLMTAHPFFASNGDMINVASDFSGSYLVYRVKKDSNEHEVIRSVKAKGPLSMTWVHDFPATDKYVAIIETPGRYDVRALLSNQLSEYALLKWAAEDDTIIHLVPLDGEEEVRTFHCPPFFAFHYGNAFESEDGRFFCFDAAVYKDLEILNDLYLDVLEKGEHEIAESTLKRFKLPLDSTSEAPIHVEAEEVLNPASHGNFADFPAINKRYLGKKHRYTYITAARRPSSLQNALGKVDMELGTCKMWGTPGGFTSEPQFIESPNPKTEDDGVVISSVLQADGTSCLVVLDASSWEELAVASIPYGIPCRFHGEFIKS